MLRELAGVAIADDIPGRESMVTERLQPNFYFYARTGEGRSLRHPVKAR